MVRARGRGEWDDWKLGDSIIVCSALAHIADDITLYVRNPNSNGIKLIQDLSEQVYSDKYKLTIKQGTKGRLIYPDQFVLPSFTVSTLPTVNPAGQMLLVTDETGGSVPAFSDGTNWRRVTDRAIVS